MERMIVCFWWVMGFVRGQKGKPGSNTLYLGIFSRIVEMAVGIAEGLRQHLRGSSDTGRIGVVSGSCGADF